MATSKCLHKQLNAVERFIGSWTVNIVCIWKFYISVECVISCDDTKYQPNTCKANDIPTSLSLGILPISKF